MKPSELEEKYMFITITSKGLPTGLPSDLLSKDLLGDVLPVASLTALTANFPIFLGIEVSMFDKRALGSLTGFVTRDSPLVASGSDEYVDEFSFVS